MPARGWTTITLKDHLVAQIDSFVTTNKWGYSNRAEVVATAVREFLLKMEHLQAKGPLPDGPGGTATVNERS